MKRFVTQKDAETYVWQSGILNWEWLDGVTTEEIQKGFGAYIFRRFDPCDFENTRENDGEGSKVFFRALRSFIEDQLGQDPDDYCMDDYC